MRNTNSWFKDHQHTSQFYINVSVGLISVIALCISTCYSSKNISEANKQYDLANKQFQLANDQFIYSKRQHIIDSIATAKKDSARETQISIQRKRDSVDYSIKEVAQNKRNSFQDSVNKKQLVALQQQANVARAQYESQQITLANQYEENRPIFFIDNVKYNKTLSSVMPQVVFHIANKGKRIAHVDSTILAVCNRKFLFTDLRRSFSNAVLNENTELTTMIPVYKECIEDNNTMYMLRFVYHDSSDKKRKITVPNFFRYVIMTDNSVKTIPLQSDQIEYFTSMLKVKKLDFMVK